MTNRIGQYFRTNQQSSSCQILEVPRGGRRYHEAALTLCDDKSLYCQLSERLAKRAEACVKDFAHAVKLQSFAWLEDTGDNVLAETMNNIGC
jgi:hypothetical protein